MTYMHDLEQKLRDRLESFAAGDLSSDQFIAFLKQSHLESYRNGQNTRPRTPDANAAREVANDFRNEKRSSGKAPYRKNYSRTA
jgi:hypothetical protein